MIKNAKTMLAPTMSNASSIMLPFGKDDTAQPIAGSHSNDNYGEDTAATSFGTTDNTDNMKPMTAKPIKSRHTNAINVPFGKKIGNKPPAPTTAKPKSRRPVPHSDKRLSMTQPDKKLPTAESSVPAMQSVDDFDIDIYATAEVSNDNCQELLTNSLLRAARRIITTIILSRGQLLTTHLLLLITVYCTMTRNSAGKSICLILR